MADLRKDAREKIGAAIRAAYDVPEVLTVGTIEKIRKAQEEQNAALLSLFQWLDAVEV